MGFLVPGGFLEMQETSRGKEGLRTLRAAGIAGGGGPGGEKKRRPPPSVFKTGGGQKGSKILLK